MNPPDRVAERRIYPRGVTGGVVHRPHRVAARRKGVIVRASGQKIVMSPPLVITDEQADTIVDVLVEELGRL